RSAARPDPPAPLRARLRAGGPPARRHPGQAGAAGPPRPPPQRARPARRGRRLRAGEPGARAVARGAGRARRALRARGLVAGHRAAGGVPGALAAVCGAGGPAAGGVAAGAAGGADRGPAGRRARDPRPGRRPRGDGPAGGDTRGHPRGGLDDHRQTAGVTMAGSAELLTAFRELTTTKQLERGELLDLLKDGIQAALMRSYGPNVKFELDVDEMKGTIRVVRLRQVAEAVEDPSWQVSLEEARYEDPDFQPGDVLEEEVPFAQFGRLAVQAAKQRIIQRVREGERNRIREEFGDQVGELLSGEIQQVERGKFVILLPKFREAEAIIPYREQNHREHFHQGDTIRAVLKKLEETPKGPRLILSRADPGFVMALFRLEVPEIQQGIVEIRGIARETGSRTKVAVISRDDAIDPVGACVGLKGSR